MVLDWAAATPAERDDHSRSLTALHALRRLGVIGTSATLTLHVIGADSREGASHAETKAVFAELLARLGADHGVRLLRMALVGPAVFGTGVAAAPQAPGAPAGCALEVAFAPGLYVDALAALPAEWGRPDAALAFQAGIWGYDTWAPTVAHVLRELRAPLLVTSYNDCEADDDCGSLEAMGLSEATDWAAPGWPPEPNPYSAAAVRMKPAVPGRALVEQASWQCLVPEKR